ncbi:MAG: CAF17-like 4Fe-4S cluster assembly/insertion protein YgfZ [Acidiferrobacteraceae bacterium]
MPDRSGMPQTAPAGAPETLRKKEGLRAPEENWVSALEHLSLIRVSGPDATSFLQGQLTNDVTARDGATLAAYCSAQGRVLALFLVIPAEDGFLLRVRTSLAPAMVARLRMFVLRAKVTLELSLNDAVTGISGAEAESLLVEAGLPVPEPRPGALATGHGVTVVRRPDATPRFEIIAAKDAAAVAHLMGRVPARDHRSWVWLDIKNGLPDVTPETSDLFVPQMLNLDGLEGISFTKGCYPGQEIVARTRYLGRLKSRMYRARAGSPAPLYPGIPLYAPNFPGQAAGHVIEAELGSDGRTDLLAVIQIAAVQNGVVHIDAPEGPRLQFEALPYPLPAPSG